MQRLKVWSGLDPHRTATVHRSRLDNVALRGGLLPAEAVAGWACTHWRAPPYHGAHPKQTIAPLTRIRRLRTS
jgi:hypothetical protein